MPERRVQRFCDQAHQDGRAVQSDGRYLTVVEVARRQRPRPLREAGAGRCGEPEALAQKFYQELPAEIAHLEQALEREDRVRLKTLRSWCSEGGGRTEIHGPIAVRLFQAAENEKSWTFCVRWLPSSPRVRVRVPAPGGLNSP